MDTTTTTRRSLLCSSTGALAIIASGVTITSTAAAANHDTSRRTWQRALEEYLAAEKASDDHWLNVEEPMIEELERRAPYPGRSFAVQALSGQVGYFEWQPSDPDAYEDAGVAIRNAARSHRLKWEAWDSAAKEMGREEVNARSNQLQDLKSEAEDLLFETPAPDLAAVEAKLNLLWADQRDLIPGFNDLVLADIRRLSRGGATA